MKTRGPGRRDLPLEAGRPAESVARGPAVGPGAARGPSTDGAARDRLERGGREPHLARQAPRADAPRTVAHGPIAVRAQGAFSRPPEDLAALLSGEVAKACDFVNALRTAFTFFGGAKIERQDPLFAAGERWGEAVFLANLLAESPALAARALESAVFSPAAVRAARAALLGVAVGAHGPSAVARALTAAGGAAGPEDLARALASLDAGSVATTDAQLLLGLAPRPRTGAGPGMMDAVPLGYVAARQKLLAAFPDLSATVLAGYATEGAVMGKLASEEKKSASIDRRETFLHFIPRRLALMEGAAGLVVFPGGIGTLNEIFEAARDGIPLVFDGRAFWGEALGVLDAKWRERDLVAPEARRYYALVDGVEEGLPYLLGDRARRTPRAAAELQAHGAEMARELERGLGTLARLPRAVSFLGGRRLRADDAEVREAEALARRLTAAGLPLRTGGAGALEDAVERGIRGAGASPASPAQSIRLAPEPGDRRSAAADARPTEVVHSAVVHKLLMYENTEALVALPGGMGTFDEVFEVACLMVTGNLPKRPLVLVGREFWQPFLDACARAMDRPDRPVVVPGAFTALFQVVDTAEEAAAILAAHRAPAAS